MTTLAPLSTVPTTMFSGLHTVLTDIDDTLTNEGVLTAQAYRALECLTQAGLRVIPLTGRPAGWCDLIARFWPVAGIVGENGAFAFRYDRPARRMIRLFAQSHEDRAANRVRLDRLAQDILTEIPGTALAADQPYRLADLAIDVREDVTPLSEADISRVLAFFQAEGATAKLSSIHVNGWFGDYDKFSTARRFLSEQFGLDLEQEAQRILFVGDSPNDEPLFAALPFTVGVANLQDYATQMRALPPYITRGRGGAGFSELAAAILSARHTPPA